MEGPGDPRLTRAVQRFTQLKPQSHDPWNRSRPLGPASGACTLLLGAETQTFMPLSVEPGSPCSPPEIREPLQLPGLSLGTKEPRLASIFPAVC